MFDIIGIVVSLTGNGVYGSSMPYIRVILCMHLDNLKRVAMEFGRQGCYIVTTTYFSPPSQPASVCVLWYVRHPTVTVGVE